MGVSMLGTMAGIITVLAGPVAPIVLPIAASAVVGVWLYEVYQESWVISSINNSNHKRFSF